MDTFPNRYMLVSSGEIICLNWIVNILLEIILFQIEEYEIGSVIA
jgi:hypothetical protein